jgi:hypothetical protein
MGSWVEYFDPMQKAALLSVEPIRCEYCGAPFAHQRVSCRYCGTDYPGHLAHELVIMSTPLLRASESGAFRITLEDLDRAFDRGRGHHGSG